ncbi:mucin-2-like [Ostrea edulis]|uniref:mucin-2-like n=1 Tax=Ostrea edulis TaxID=37623 RepID=UPI0024AF1C8C|nr:mucin-2-like [Ostrea edulis]
MAVGFAGAVLLVAIVVILVKRQRVMNVTTQGFYLGVSRQVADTTSESYMRVEENIYDEPELVSLDYIDPVDDSDKNNYITNRHDRPREEREDRTKEKSTVLSLLMRKRKESEFDKVDKEYIDIMEIGSGTDSLPASPPLKTLTTTSTLPLQTTSQLTTEPPVRFPPVEKKKNQLTTALSKKFHQSVARETNTTTQPTVAKANTSTSPLDSAIDTQSPTSLGVKVTEQPSSPITITTEIVTRPHSAKPETTKLSSVALIKLPSDTLSEPTKTTDSTTLHIPRTRKNVKTKTFLQPQPTTTGQPTTTRQTNSKSIQHMIDFHETAQRKK